MQAPPVREERTVSSLVNFRPVIGALQMGSAESRRGWVGEQILYTIGPSLQLDRDHVCLFRLAQKLREMIA